VLGNNAASFLHQQFAISHRAHSMWENMRLPARFMSTTSTRLINDEMSQSKSARDIGCAEGETKKTKNGIPKYFCKI
jgi:hypothetical protein